MTDDEATRELWLNRHRRVNHCWCPSHRMQAAEIERLGCGPPRAGHAPPCGREVLALVARGRSNTEIASELYVGAGTVITHIAHLLTKLDARDRVQLVIIAYRTGLVPPS